MARVIKALLIATAVLLSFGSCATGVSGRSAPDWVLQPPPASDDFEYFVASATDDEAAGDPAAAEELAGHSLLVQINQALGVDIDVQTSAEARSTLEAYEATLVQQVTQSGGGRVQGLRIADRYIIVRDGRTTVYVLGEYEREAFAAERARRIALLQQQEELFLTPERQADQLVRDGRLAEAILLYAQAATAAASSEIEIARVVLERAAQKAATVASALRIEAVAGPVNIDVGVIPDEPVVFRLTDNDGIPVPGAPVEISYTARRGERDVVRSVVLSSDESGLVFFDYPTPDRVGAVSVTARLESAALLSLFDGLPAEVRASADAFEAGIISARATYEFVAQSRAREISTVVIVADRDVAGNTIDGDTAASGIVQALSGAGFLLRSTAVDSDVLLGRSDADVIAHLQVTLPADIRRAVYGVAEIVDLYEDDGYLVKVRATVTAVDLASGRILYATSGIKNARSRTAERAISSALMELGIDLGDELAASLP